MKILLTSIMDQTTQLTTNQKTNINIDTQIPEFFDQGLKM